MKQNEQITYLVNLLMDTKLESYIEYDITLIVVILDVLLYFTNCIICLNKSNGKAYSIIEYLYENKSHDNSSTNNINYDGVIVSVHWADLILIESLTDNLFCVIVESLKNESTPKFSRSRPLIQYSIN